MVTPRPSRPRRGDATIRRAQTILCERLREPGAPLGNPSAVRELLRVQLATKPHEIFVALWLDTQNRLIFPEELFRGSLTQTTVHPREVVKSALACNAAGVIFAHNHPSGALEPSRADIELTAQLRSALRLVDVQMLDHFLVAGTATPLSFAERGLLSDDASSHSEDDVPQPVVHEFDFSASTRLYSVAAQANLGDIRDQLCARLGQLHAMLTITYGEGAEAFDSWSVDIKDKYQWGCAMISRECEELARLL